jgi:hypothetical protein
MGSLPLAWSLLCRQEVIACHRGNTIIKCTKNAAEVERLFRRLKGFRRIFVAVHGFGMGATLVAAKDGACC